MAEQKQIHNRPIPRPADAGAQAVLTPRDIFLIFRRHLWMISIATVVGFVFGGVSWFLLARYSPKYTSQTFLRVLPPIEKDPTKIGATLPGKELLYGHRLSIADLLTQQGNLQELLNRDKIQETQWFKSFGRAKGGGQSKAVSLQKGFMDLRKNLNAYAHRDTDFVIVSMTCGSGQEAAIIVNEMVDMFVASRGSVKTKELSNKLSALRQQEDDIRADLAESERALDVVRTRSGFHDLEQQRFESAIEVKLNQLEIDQDRVAQNISQVTAAIGNLARQAAGPIAGQVQVENQIERDPIVLSLAQQIVLREVQLAGLMTKFGENHKVVIQAQTTIDETRLERERRKIEIGELTRLANLGNAKDQLIVFESRLEELNDRKTRVEAEKRDLDIARIEYQKRVRIRDERQRVLEEIKMDIERRVAMLSDPETPKVAKVGPALPPLERSFPKWSMFFSGGTFLGALLGVGLAFLVELLNDLVRTPRDIAKFLHIPVLCMIPDASEDDQTRNVDLHLVVRNAPYSITSECYRRFRTNLKLSTNGKASKVISVTSPSAGEGKTSIAVNLAITLIADEKRVLLIDTNFWQPTIYKLFPAPASQDSPPDQDQQFSEFGLSTLLAGLCGPQQVIRSSGIDRLSIIDSGLLPSNPAELLGGARMRQFINQQRQNYDYIILDGPPVLLVSEAKVLAKLADGAILVFNAATTRRGAAQRTIRELRAIDVEIFGSVLLGARSLKGGYFREQFRSYQDYQKLQLAHSI